MNDIVIGIDLGTTNSEVAAYVNGKIEIIEENSSSLIPSYVGVDAEGKLLVGEEAKNQYVLYPDQTVKSIKRKMGSNKKILLGDKEYLPQEISAMILQKLKIRAENYLKIEVKKAVITVPAQFSDAQRQATRDAGVIAGLEVLRIINEPTAACLAYKNETPEKVSNILTFDLGGGTFDVSLVRMEKDIVEVIASHGDNYLGGDDFDDAIVDWIKKKVYKCNDSSDSLSKRAEYRLSRAAEKAKVHLSDFAYAKIIEDNLETEKNSSHFSFSEEISRNEFETLICPFLDKALLAVHQTLADAEVKASEVDDIVLVGGSSRIPAIAKILEKEFGKNPRRDIHPDLAVVYGAGLMAARLMGENDSKILIDITPQSFGISCLGEIDDRMCPYLYAPIIKSGTPLPVSKEEIFYTSYDDQDAVDVKIFQGEDMDARKNNLIGRFKIEDLSEVPAGNKIAMNMRLDLDGILRVSAIEKDTALTKQVSIENASAKLTDSQIENSKKEIQNLFADEYEERLLDNGYSCYEDEENHEGKSLNFPINTGRLSELKSRVSACKDEMDKTDREDADELLLKLTSAAEKNDEKLFDSIAAEIEDLLFYVEV
jgi:molecular chaperone DnaK